MYSMDPRAPAGIEYQQYPVPLTGSQQYPPSPVGIPNDFRMNVQTTWPSVDDIEAVATLAKMNHRVSDQGFYIPSPVCTSSNVFSFDDIPDIKPTPVCHISIPKWPSATRSVPHTHTSCQIKGDSYTIRPFPLQFAPRPSRSSCMGQATTIGKMLLGDRQSSRNVHSPLRGSSTIASDSSTIASDILLEDFGHDGIPDLSPTMSVGLSDNFFDAIDYIDAYATTHPTIHQSVSNCKTIDCLGISISDQENAPPTKTGRKQDKTDHGKHCCEICKKTFNSQSNLRQHIRVHTGEKPYECQVCSKRFTQSSSLRTHHRIHTGERPYSCPVCSRAFSDYSTWRKHCRLHSGERPYVCDTCGKGFAQSGNLIRHRLTHQKIGPVLKLERM